MSTSKEIYVKIKTSMATFFEKEFKSILNKKKMIDNWFWNRYSINPYNGCQFGCLYCDSRSAKYYLPVDFSNTIIVKKNVREMLDQRISRARTFLPDVVGIGGTTDAYQPAEKKYQNTLACLEVLKKHAYPILIITKSDLILRDLDLLAEIASTTWATVGVTITTTKDSLSRFLEPRVPSSSERFEVIKKIKDNSPQIQAGIIALPIIPFLDDSDEELEALVKKSKEVGADFIIFGGLTMRDQQRDYFLSHLKEKFPKVAQKIKGLYQDDYFPAGENKTDQKMLSLCQRYGLNYRIKRFIPNDSRREAYLLAETLLNQSYTNQILGKPWKKLFWEGQKIQQKI